MSCCILDDDDLSEACFDLHMGGLSTTLGNAMATGGMGRGASNFSLGRAASEDMGEGLNVGLVGGSREGTLGGQK